MAIQFLYGGNYPGMDEANSANNQRYSAVNSGYDQLLNQLAGSQQNILGGYNQMLADQKGLGEGQRQSLDQDYARQQAASQQSMISRGLGNTTVQDSAQRGLSYQQQLAQMQLSDMLRREQTGLQQGRLSYMDQAAQQMAGARKSKLDFQGSRQDMLAVDPATTANISSREMMQAREIQAQLRMEQQKQAGGAMAQARSSQSDMEMQRQRLDAQRQLAEMQAQTANQRARAGDAQSQIQRYGDLAARLRATEQGYNQQSAATMQRLDFPGQGDFGAPPGMGGEENQMFAGGAAGPGAIMPNYSYGQGGGGSDMFGGGAGAAGNIYSYMQFLNGSAPGMVGDSGGGGD